MEKNTALKVLKTLLGKYKNKMINIGAYFWSELKKWYSFWEAKFKTVDKTQELPKARARVAGKQTFLLNYPPAGIIQELKSDSHLPIKIVLFASVKAL